jgi:hypothetical protein
MVASALSVASLQLPVNFIHCFRSSRSTVSVASSPQSPQQSLRGGSVMLSVCLCSFSHFIRCFRRMLPTASSAVSLISADMSEVVSATNGCFARCFSRGVCCIGCQLLCIRRYRRHGICCGSAAVSSTASAAESTVADVESTVSEDTSDAESAMTLLSVSEL